MLCCVTDNASNMVKLIKDLNTDQRAAAVDSSSEEDSGTNKFRFTASNFTQNLGVLVKNSFKICFENHAGMIIIHNETFVLLFR